MQAGGGFSVESTSVNLAVKLTVKQITMVKLISRISNCEV